jgi:hypothetical protein
MREQQIVHRSSSHCFHLDFAAIFAFFFASFSLVFSSFCSTSSAL